MGVILPPNTAIIINIELVSNIPCGDANSDGSVNVGDAVYIINYVFKGGTAPEDLDMSDANGDGTVNVGDAVYLINYVFKGSGPPLCQ